MVLKLSRTDLGDLNIFRIVAENGGFRRAASALDISPSALSHAIQALETRYGVRLFNRTTRSLKLTPAGRDLLTEIEGGFSAIEAGLEALNHYRERPAGQLRLNVLSDAARLVLAPMLAEYTLAYPEVRLEVVVQDTMVDIVREGYDAGIRYGDAVPEDMISMALGPDLRWIMAASPEYLAAAAPIATPEDLSGHACIGMRMGNGRIYHWELERRREKRVLNMDWPVILNETALILELTERGGGICYCLEGRIAQQLETGRLVRVLPEWSSMGPGFHLYYPSRRQVPEALRAFMRMAKKQKQKL